MDIKENGISIDLEDWYHPEFVRKYIKETPKSQIVESTLKILNLLEKYNVKATFFILGDIAQKNPDLIKDIYHRGHEIGFHGMHHLPLSQLNVHKFNEDLSLFRKLLRNIFKKDINIYGFRAPTFSINAGTNYALKCLENNNYLYDSSVVPASMFFYGLKDAPLNIYRPNLDNPSLIDNNSKLIEFPISVIQFTKLRLAISGGFFLRALPYFIYKFLIRRINIKSRRVLIYFHPWETNRKTYKVNSIGILKYFLSYFKINSTLKKIEKLIQDFKFGPVKDIIRENLKL